MKKILAFVLTLSLLSTFFAVPAFAKAEEMSIENGQTILSDGYLIKDDDMIKYYTFCSDGNISATSFGGETKELCISKRIASEFEKDFENFDKVVYYSFTEEAAVFYKDGRNETVKNFDLAKYIKPYIQYKNTKTVESYGGKYIITIKSEGTIVVDYCNGTQVAFRAEEGNNCDKLIKALEKQYENFDYISVSPQEIIIFYKDGSWENVEKLSVNIKQ